MESFNSTITRHGWGVVCRVIKSFQSIRECVANNLEAQESIAIEKCVKNGEIPGNIIPGNCDGVSDYHFSSDDWTKKIQELLETNSYKLSNYKFQKLEIN